MMMHYPDAREIASQLSEAQKRSMLSPRWLHPGGMAPVCLVTFTDPWPEGVAQFFTTYMDSLTDLGLAVRAVLMEGDGA